MNYLVFIISVSAFFVASTTFSAELRSESVLEKINCDKSTVVTLIGEVHGSLSSRQVAEHTMSLANEKFVYYSNEAIRINDRSWAGHVFGIEEPIPYAASLTFLAESVLNGFQNTTYEQLTSETHRLVVSKSVGSLMSAVKVEETKRLIESDNIAYGLLIDANKSARQGTKQEILQNELLTKISLQDWYLFASSFSSLLKKKLIEIYPKLLDEKTVTSILGSGRNILFAKNIMAKYCEAAKARKAIYVQMGQGHSKQVSDLLKLYLPSTADVRILTTDDVAQSYKGFKERFETSGFLKDYKFLMKQDPESLDYPLFSTPSVYVWPKQLKISSNQIRALKEIAKKWGFEVSYSGAISVFELPKI